MKIRQLELKNFRCFDQTTFEFSDQFNVFIGDNGTGKSAILDALAIGVGSFFLGIDSINSRNIFKDEVRHIVNTENETPTLTAVLPCVVSCKGYFEDIQELSWSRELRIHGGKTTREGAKEITKYARDLQIKSQIRDIQQASIRKQEKDNRRVLLPVISYYGTGRLWIQRRETVVETLSPNSRFRGYENCLSNSYELKKLIRWFKTQEFASLQKQKTIGVLSAVKEAIKTCMDDWEDVRFDVHLDELVATSKNGKTLPFRMLSDGVRNMIGMVADIAYRSAVLNPHLETDAPKETQGVVLIDEIDLHLHPNWQRRVVDDLKRTFPKIQFFATTHSEHIIQSLREGELIDLNSPESIPEAEYENKSIEDIAENIMHVPNPYRSERYQNMMEVAQKYYQILQEVNGATSEEAERLKVQLDELIEPFSDNVAYHAFLQMKRAAMLDEE
ncbi:AAA family ATPase [Pseudanabaena sp. 'Roaring Creek']|uniref:AAA family ATPase n=1 Tax=Pseudanabaena sp. 'Roaring Creek' TaxID=1681830 RepID=UPI0006D7F612|nr:AAA family ATPase [Pseudanabaena sp. 'Roaring Creek']